MPLPYKNIFMCTFWKRITIKRRSHVSSSFMFFPERFVQSYFRPWILKLIISLIYIRFITRLEDTACWSHSSTVTVTISSISSLLALQSIFFISDL
jgi:hypothetical protein